MNNGARHTQHNRNIVPKQGWVNPRPNENSKLQELAMNLSQTIRPASALTALAMLAISAVPVSSSPMSAAKPNFDGSWSVLIVTEQGKCDRAYRYPVKIENGSVGYAGSASFTVDRKRV